MVVAEHILCMSIYSEEKEIMEIKLRGVMTKQRFTFVEELLVGQKGGLIKSD